MHRIELHTEINKLMEGYRRLGYWHRGNVATVTQTGIQMFYLIYFLMFPISLIAGAMASDNKYEFLLLVETAIMWIVALVRIFYLMWRQNEITEFLQRICVYSVKDEKDFTVAHDKLNSFMKWISYFFYYIVVIAGCVALVLPFIGSDKTLFLNFGFPLDYENSEFAYWLAFLFLVSGVIFSLIGVSFSIMIWYFLFHCGLKYKILENRLGNMGVIRTVDAAGKKLNISEVEKRKIFYRDLIAGIESHKDIKEATQQLNSFLSKLFSIQLATSAACICASVYILAFNNTANIIEYLVYITYALYNICDIFAVMYLGNEIQLSSDRLSYCLFQSTWMDQPQSCKKIIIVFGECLKQPQQLVILKLYPLTLETFTRIMNGAYSMFNILKTLAM